MRSPQPNDVMRSENRSGAAGCGPARGGVRGWQRWAPHAAVAWSLGYAGLAAYWALSGRGFPYGTDVAPDAMSPLMARFGAGAAWIVVIAAGIPAAAAGAAMLRGVSSTALRPLFISTGAVLAAVLLLLMTGLNLLVLLGYVPFVVRSLFAGGEVSQRYVNGLTQWATIHQVLCLVGGFLWLAATVCYARRSGGRCLHCGRGDGPGWPTPKQAARWGRVAVSVSIVVPIFYAVTRYAWAMGIPLGMSPEFLHRGQEKGIWISGLFLAHFGLVGAILTLGLIQRWGEVFPRWMLGLAGRRVPIALAVVPVSLASVLLVVGGIVIWSGVGRMVAALASGGAEGLGLVEELFFQAGPALLFPVWGVALAVAALCYYYRRRRPCAACGRGASEGIGGLPAICGGPQTAAPSAVRGHTLR